ncbi:MAG: hypothetical protein KAT04_03620 [Methylococcales bacterium]|nr:hypothetical protein [Methylococcales bacterium]
MKLSVLLTISILAANSSSVIASDTTPWFGLTAKVGTLGGGLDLTIPTFVEEINLRAGIAGAYFDGSGTVSDIDYDASLRLLSGTLLGDYHPFNNGFRLSGGMVINGNEVTLEGQPSAGTSFTFNNTTYTAASIGSVDAEVDFNAVAPYLGIGYGNAIGTDGNFHFAFDLGVMYQGSPNVSLTATCGAALPAAQCASLQADVRAEETDLEAELDDFKFYPVVSFGVSYHF